MAVDCQAVRSVVIGAATRENFVRAIRRYPKNLETVVVGGVQISLTVEYQRMGVRESRINEDRTLSLWRHFVNTCTPRIAAASTETGHEQIPGSVNRDVIWRVGKILCNRS